MDLGKMPRKREDQIRLVITHLGRSVDGSMPVDGWMDRWIDGWMDGWKDGRMEVWMDGWIDGWMDGWMDGWVGGCDRQKDSQIDTYIYIYSERDTRAGGRFFSFPVRIALSVTPPTPPLFKIISL